MDKYTQWTQLHNYVYDGFDVCEACRANKPARISIKLYSDDELDFETYLIGSECSKKAFIYHELKHFRAHMYQKVRNLVSDNRYNANTSQEVFDNLLQKGHVRKVKRLLLIRSFGPFIDSCFILIVEKEHHQSVLQCCTQIQPKRTKGRSCRWWQWW